MHGAERGTNLCGAVVAVFGKQRLPKTKVAVIRRLTKKKVMRSGMVARTTWTAVQQVSGSGQCVRPEIRWGCSVKKHCVHAVIETMKNALGTANLLRCVWAREAQDDAMRGEERASCVVIKFFPVICLNAHNGALKLSQDKGVKRDQHWQDIRFVAKWK